MASDETAGPECWAIVPARGGSKGIPGKNLRRLGGRTLVARSVDAALAAGRVARAIVSTDDPAIAAEAERAGAEVVMRPPELAGDGASSESALLHALESLEATHGRLPGLVAFLQCTSPFTVPGDIDACVAALIEQEADSALAAAPFHGFLWRPGAEGARGVNHDPAVRQRRQDRPAEYVETGAVYVFRTAGFRAAGHRFFGRTVLCPVPAERALEIDEPADLALAEARLAAGDRAGRAARLPAPPAALVMDFDGVFTDNRVLVLEDGREGVLCSRGDGLGLERLRRALDLPCLILSKERNPVVTARAAKLGIEVLHGIEDKETALRDWAAERGVALARTVFVGNDVNDLACLRLAGCGVAVADAVPEARAGADLVLEAPGGAGALRELCDLLREAAAAREGGA
jgi:YrbI family 3-deoxy-D-manno-octulosonate 8-phosphate phosphatase